PVKCWFRGEVTVEQQRPLIIPNGSHPRAVVGEAPHCNSTALRGGNGVQIGGDHLFVARLLFKCQRGRECWAPRPIDWRWCVAAINRNVQFTDLNHYPQRGCLSKRCLDVDSTGAIQRDVHLKTQTINGHTALE